MMDPLAVLLKSSLILVAALGLAAASRRAPASGRYTLWATALIGVLALPLLTGALPSLPLPLLPASAVPGADRPFTRMDVSSPARDGGSGALAATSSGVKDLEREAMVSGTPPSTSAGASQAGGDERALPGIPIGTWIWIAGAVVLLLRLILGAAQVRRMIGRARPVTSGPGAELLGALSRDLGVTRSVRLMRAEGAGSPVTWGWLRPVIVLPASSDGWEPDRMKVVLLHELIHVRRLHWPLQILAALAAAAHWFNPLVWIASRRLEVERELACDEGVLAQGTRASDYAEHLVGIARTLDGARRPPAASLAVSLTLSRSLDGGRSRFTSLERRLDMILDPRKGASHGRWSALALAGMAAAILPVAAFQLRAEPAEPEDPAPIAKPAEPAMPALPSEPSPAEEPTASFMAARVSSPAKTTRTTTGYSYQYEDDGDHFQMRYSDDDFSLRKIVDGVELSLHIEDPDTVEFSRDNREITAMGRSAEVVIRTEYEGARQRLEISRDGDELRYDWTIDGERRPFDSRAREWMGLSLQIARNSWEASSLRGQHSSLRGQISSIHGHVSSLKGQISSIHGHRSSLRGKVSSINGHVSSLNGRISSIRGHESSLRGRISSLNGRISSLRAQKTRVSSGGSDERRALSEQLNESIDREIAGIEAQIRDVEVELRDYDGDARVRKVEQEIREYDAEGRIAAVEAELAEYDVEGRVREIEQEIREYDEEGRVRDVEARIRKLQPLERADEIERRNEGLYPALRRVAGELR